MSSRTYPSYPSVANTATVSVSVFVSTVKVVAFTEKETLGNVKVSGELIINCVSLRTLVMVYGLAAPSAVASKIVKVSPVIIPSVKNVEPSDVKTSLPETLSPSVPLNMVLGADEVIVSFATVLYKSVGCV